MATLGLPTKDDERPAWWSFDSMRISLASPELIRQWSHGEVKKPETINYRTFKPEKDGLFCEKIFGPTKDWECSCGKYKRIKHKDVVCDRCGVEVIQSKVRRERIGHIELAAPVAHVWFLKGIPSRIGYLLEMSGRQLEKIAYYESYVVIDPGDTGLRRKQLLSGDEYRKYREQYGATAFRAKMGGEALRDLLKELDVEEMCKKLRADMKVTTSQQKLKDIIKRLKVAEAFRRSGNRPHWMVLDCIPVLPPELRPLVPLDGGRFATCDLNDLYRRVINRNNRLKKLAELKAPDVIIRNEKRMLQESVDALFDNGRRGRVVKGLGNRPLKSLSDILKGKQGRFRQNLLGKRVDYSGRSVIVVGPELKLHQCGLPKKMALELFKPFIIRKLEERGYVHTIKSAKKMVEKARPEVWEILEEIVKDHPILLNRAPTLHRMGVQAFMPVLIDGKAIQIHPLVCTAFNADFDGDQMAVHVPLSTEAQLEARLLLMSVHNILSTASGKPIVTPTQDMVLGLNYLTKELPGGPKHPPAFSSFTEVSLAYALANVDVHDKIRLRHDGKLIQTTVGRALFNERLPKGMPYLNRDVNKKELGTIIAFAYRHLGPSATVAMLDEVKELGFESACRAGITVGIDDMKIPADKKKILTSSEREVQGVEQQYQKGIITEGERYNKVIDIWTHATDAVADAMFEELRKDRDGFNPVFSMADSGARGSKLQIRQLAGMRGLMARPQQKITGQVGEIIESPIRSNFREGLNVLEYFISTHGARKGLADTALKTADAGYLTRRLVDVAQDVIVTEDDCGTVNGISIGALREGTEVIEQLRERILGRVALDNAVDVLTDEVLVRANEEINEEKSERVEQAGIERIRIRSVLTCEARRGVCRLCYGRNLATGRLVELGEAVGVVAAQSIGEPGTQLTLRTFHVGGTAARVVEQSKIESGGDGKVKFQGLRSVPNRTGGLVVLSRNAEIAIEGAHAKEKVVHTIPYGAVIKVKEGQAVTAGTLLAAWDVYATPIFTEHSGRLRFEDIIEDVTLREEVDEYTGLSVRKIVEARGEKLHPRFEILDPRTGKVLSAANVPTDAILMANDGDEIAAGDVLAKIPRETSRTKDITGGLPRVAELFEARKSKDAAVIADIAGTVRMGGSAKGGMRKLIVEGDGRAKEYAIPQGRHLSVREGDQIEAGESLCDGSINPHDVLRVKGEMEVMEYLVNKIQEVYRLQGVTINDKHIETIVRQMLRKVRIENVGDTTFMIGQQVDRWIFQEENARVVRSGGEPATAKPVLLGITKASLGTESFVSAASFQETTRVLTEAAIAGKTDMLQGLKENVIMGHLIPAGTGMRIYRDIDLRPLVIDVAAHAQGEADAAEVTGIAPGAVLEEAMK